MLYRFRKAIQNEDAEGWTPPNPNEPLLPSTCTSLPAALYARRQLTKEISRKLSRIQDASLDDATIRSLNDDLNRMIRERHEWDATLRALGHTERDKTVKWGEDALPEPGNVHGYYYFGRAKELPGVKELLHPKKEQATKLPARILMMQRTADPAYYGITDPDGEAEQSRLQGEAQVEKKLLSIEGNAVDWVTGLPFMLPPFLEYPPMPPPPTVPTQAQVEQHLIERQRRRLLERYTE